MKRSRRKPKDSLLVNRELTRGSTTLRLMRRTDHPNNPIRKIHCWIAKFADGHEEIVLRVSNVQAGPSEGLQPLIGKGRLIREGLGRRDPAVVGVRLASFLEE